jgi:hypothetical protein
MNIPNRIQKTLYLLEWWMGNNNTCYAVNGPDTKVAYKPMNIGKLS